MFKNFDQMMKQAQKLQGQLEEVQARIAETEMTGTSGAGMVQVTLNGRGEAKSVKIDKSLMDPNDVEVLEDLLVAALKDARQKIDAYSAEEMGKATQGLPLPGGMKLPF